MQDASQSNDSPRARILTVDRSQVDPFPKTIDQLIPRNHQARAVWKMVNQLDFQPLLDAIESREGHPGRPAIDPRILAALWLYATTQGITASRQLEGLVKYHDAYKWIAGGVSVSYHTLSDFRVDHNDWLDAQIARIVTELVEEGLADFDQVAQDGMRVRASAGRGSFKKDEELRELSEQARQQLESIHQETSCNDPAQSARQRSARRRAAAERSKRLEDAQQQVKEVAQGREKRKKGAGAAARASTTDPEARRMKMADGGYRPAMNIQYATLLGSLLVAGVMVINAGTDAGQMTPMIDSLQSTYGRLPKEYFADGSYSKLSDIENNSRRNITTYVPVKADSRAVNPYTPRPRDSEEIKAWRARMAISESQQKYQRRCLSEWTHARARQFGMTRLLVRGLEKARSVALWHALAQNLTRATVLRAAQS